MASKAEAYYYKITFNIDVTDPDITNVPVLTQEHKGIKLICEPTTAVFLVKTQTSFENLAQDEIESIVYSKVPQLGFSYDVGSFDYEPFAQVGAEISFVDMNKAIDLDAVNDEPAHSQKKRKVSDDDGESE